MYLQESSRTYGILGILIDSIDSRSVLHNIDQAVSARRRLLLSTVNANFLVASQRSQRFRRSLLASDLCTVDGIAVLAVCRLLGLEQVPRASGADILEQLCGRTSTDFERPLRVFFFGGATGVAEAARQRVNDLKSGAVLCVGAIDPGFGSVEELSRPEWIQAINDANPDILILALGAEKGQAWLLHNAECLSVPVRTHFGAAVNFLAGKVRRAPLSLQRFGLEWLWRIAQEPPLARRYLSDGVGLVRLTLGNILPLAVLLAVDRLLLGKQLNQLVVNVRVSEQQLCVFLSGSAGASTMTTLHAVFDEAIVAGMPVTLDMGELLAIDLDGIGAIMRLRRDLESRGLSLRLKHARARILRRMQFAVTGFVA